MFETENRESLTFTLFLIDGLYPERYVLDVLKVSYFYAIIYFSCLTITIRLLFQ